MTVPEMVNGRLPVDGRRRFKRKDGFCGMIREEAPAPVLARSRFAFSTRVVCPPVVWLLCLAAGLFSCSSEKAGRRGVRDPAELFREAADTVAMIYTRYEIDSNGHARGYAYVGCFVSADGKVLTAAHQMQTTHPVYFVYRNVDGSEYSTTATLAKSDPHLDLALLEPVHPIKPAKYLRPGLESLPAPGRSVAILSFLICDRESPNSYRMNSITPTTVSGVLRKGRFGMNVEGYHGLSGSPVVDMVTGRLVGIVVARKGRGESAYGFRYAIAQSTASARHFLSSLPEAGQE